MGEGLQQPLLHDVVLGADVITSAVGAHKQPTVGVGPEDDTAAAFAADKHPGQRIGDSVGSLDGRRPFPGNQLLGREENSLVHDGRVQTFNKDLLLLVDVPADFANVDGVFED